MDDTTTSSPPAVYQHSSKPAWGVAVVQWERDGKRGYLFEDGEVRVIQHGYYHLMTEVDVSTERAAALHAAVDRPDTTDPALRRPRPARKPVSLDEQLAFFLDAYPDGFAGETWRNERRAAPGRPLKRHRDAALERARDSLTLDALDRGLAGDPAAALGAVAALLASTDLVSRTHAATLGKGGPKVLRALRDVLDSSQPFAPNFDRWVAAAGAAEPPMWNLATAPLALADPELHLCVRATAFRAQAASLAPRLDSRRLNHATYRRLLAMATRIREHLGERGFAPADLLDLHDFVRFTLNPKARAAILAERAAPTA